MNIYFTKRLLGQWSHAQGKAAVSFDLGMTQRNVGRKRLEEIVGDINMKLGGERLKENYIYLLKKGEIYRLALFHDSHFYKLKMMNGFREPVLEIDGIRMHVIRGFSSANDHINEIMKLIDGNRGSCLEICSGLGYWTSGLSKRYGKVVTIEKSKAVIALAKLNPHSRGLFSRNVKRIYGDAFGKVGKIREKFDCVVHDPPRYTHAPQLYSNEFYGMLRERLNPGGRLFHYTGTFTSHGGFHANIGKSLESAGFRDVKRIERMQGFIARL